MRIDEPPELDADMRAVIDAAHGGHEPNELNRARVRKGVELKLAAGIALAVGPASSALAGALKVTVAAVAVGSVVAAGVYALPRRAVEPRPVPASRAADRAVAPAPEIPVEILAPVASATRAPKRRAISHAPAQVAVESASSLKEETALLGAANAALGRGEIGRALSVLKEYDRRPGAPMLAEERAVTGILASCAGGQADEARAEAQRFRAHWPRSPLGARVDGSCAGSPSRR